MGTIIQNIGNIVVSDRKLSLFSDIQMGLALSKWPPIGLKFCMVVSRSVIFKIRLVLEGSEILRHMVILPIIHRTLHQKKKLIVPAKWKIAHI
jgi:hypothetical protein